jgi:hypothetical protein
LDCKDGSGKFQNKLPDTSVEVGEWLKGKNESLKLRFNLVLVHKVSKRGD